MDEIADDRVFFDELRWRLSNINPNVPRPSGAEAADSSPQSLLYADIIDSEHRAAEWEGIAKSYRELAQICIEAAARHYATAVRLTRENKALRELL